MLDITIDMDVKSQPGPVTDRSLGGVNKNYLTLMRTKLAPFERSGLLSLRNNAFKPSPAVLSQFKSPVFAQNHLVRDVTIFYQYKGTLHYHFRVLNS